jgi:hypothetical protein
MMRYAIRCVVVMAACVQAGAALGQKAPPQAEWDKATADITGTNAAAQTAAIEKANGWIKGGWVSADVWRKWIPALVKAGKHQEVLEMATLAECGRAGMDAIVPLQEARLRAYLALGKNDEALKVAKGYYNVVEIKNTAAAVDFVGTCLAKAHPEDGEIVRKFRNEQAQASQGTAPEKAMLKEIVVDSGPFEAALRVMATKTRYIDRVAYGNLLLIADKGEDAEKLFRELYQVAATQEELTQATEGIARALRAEDGNVARANAWLVKVQSSGAGAGLPSGTKPAASAPAGGAGAAGGAATRGGTGLP